MGEKRQREAKDTPLSQTRTRRSCRGPELIDLETDTSSAGGGDDADAAAAAERDAPPPPPPQPANRCSKAAAPRATRSKAPVRAGIYREGDRVEAKSAAYIESQGSGRVNAGKQVMGWLGATIRARHADGDYSIDYSNGDAVQHAPAVYIRRPVYDWNPDGGLRAANQSRAAPAACTAMVVSPSVPPARAEIAIS